LASENTSIRISFFLWWQLVHQLRRRGQGQRESGAFLLGRADKSSGKVSSFICYDDLDPHAYQSGAIAFHAEGCAALWEHCRNHGLQVLADAHTHPGWGVGQSHIDQENPMIPVKGHTGMILPNFAATVKLSLAGVGIYEYLGGYKWRIHDPAARPARVRLVMW
jgi:hypothetical protein